MQEERIKLKLSKNSLIFLLALILVFLIVFLFLPKLTYQPLTTLNFKGVLLQFRADLREANKIEADEESIRNILWNRNLKNVTIVFTNSSDLDLVGVEAFEISYKLRLAYLLEGYNVEIKGKQVEDLSSLDSLPKPSIVLIPPSLSNKTSIEVKDSIIIISGKDKKEFDLTTVKFLIIALNLKL